MNKSIVILASVLATAALAGCTKEALTEEVSTNEGKVISLTINPDTKTTFDGVSKTAWVEGDAISVFICKHDSSATATWKNYKFTCEDVATGKFTGTVDGLSDTEKYDVFAFYPTTTSSTPAEVSFNLGYKEAIDGIEGKIDTANQPLWGAQTEGQTIAKLSMNMHQVTTFVQVDLTAADKDVEVTEIALRAPDHKYLGTKVTMNLLNGSIADFATTYSNFERMFVTVTNGTIAAGKTGVFNIPVRPFTVAEGKTLTCDVFAADGTKMTIDMTAPAGGYDFAGGKLSKIKRTYAANTEIKTPECLAGVFSVSDTTKVKFTKGNLYWDGADFAYENAQYDYPEIWNTKHIGHFNWNTKKENAITAAYTTDYDDLQTAKCFADSIATGYRLLTKDEWNYIIAHSKIVKLAIVHGVRGTLIAPDGFEGSLDSTGWLDETWSAIFYSDEAFAALEAKGVLFLPAAGYRYTSTAGVVSVYNTESLYSSTTARTGYYWTSSYAGSGKEYIFYFTCKSFYSQTYKTYNQQKVSYGCPIRLAIDTK